MLDSSDAYKNEIHKGGRIISIHDDYRFADGTEPEINTGSFMRYSINEATSDNSAFSIGATIIKKYTASLNNLDGAFDTCDFEDLNIVAKVGLQLPDGSIEIIPKGKYRCVKAASSDNTIDIEAYDSMLFFDKPYSESTLVYPATILEIVKDACIRCQMILNEKTVQNKDFVVQERPDDANITFRDVIGYCAQVMCCYAVIDKLDQLSFGWYDFDLLEDLRSQYDNGALEEIGTYHHIKSLGSRSVNTDDICISGIAIKPVQESSNEEDIYLFGSDDYALSIEENPLIQNMAAAESIAAYIGGKMVGKRFRPLNVSCQSDPCMEAGDCICVTDRKQRTYFSVITNTTFSVGGLQAVECTAETPTEKNYTKYSAVTKLLARTKKDTAKQIETYDLAVQQLANLVTESLGVFVTKEKAEDGSAVYYLHNKPEVQNSSTIWKMTANAFAVSTDGGQTWNAGMDNEGNTVVNVLSAIGINFDWAKGGTLTLGGEDNVDGVLKVYNAAGEVVCKISKDGVETNSANITGGTINIATDGSENNVIVLRRILESGSSYYARLSPTWIRLQDVGGGMSSNLMSDRMSLTWNNNGVKYESLLSSTGLEFFKDGNVIGGMKQGVVIGNEHGNNGNGEYYKFHDGTLICVKKMNLSFTCHNTWGPLYDSDVINLGNWPYAFKYVPTISATFCAGNAFTWSEGFSDVSTTSAGKTYLCRATDIGSIITGTLHVTGIGQWK